MEAASFRPLGVGSQHEESLGVRRAEIPVRAEHLIPVMIEESVLAEEPERDVTETLKSEEDEKTERKEKDWRTGWDEKPEMTEQVAEFERIVWKVQH